MKKLLLITAFTVAVSLSASFATAQIEIRDRPNYDQQRDRQWMQTQQNQQMEQRQKEEWQREKWQQEQRQRHERHQESQDYYLWLRLHQRDYDHRR